jgi:uncharacterized protein (DUF1501 family)
MGVSRRTFLKGAGAVAGLQVAGPFLGRAMADSDPQHTARRRLIVVDLGGGNDGLNTVVPLSGPNRDVYDKVRPTIALAPSSLHPLDRGGRDDGTVGLHPSLVTLHQLYQAGRVAVVQGVDYPNHSYSHFTSNDIWQAGNPDNYGDAGWLGRHLDRTGVTSGELRAVGIGGDLPHALRGRVHSGCQINSLAATHFTEKVNALSAARHEVFARFAEHRTSEPDRHTYGTLCASVVELDTATRGLVAPAPGGLANDFLTARTLLAADLGVEVVFISTKGYDNHANQLSLHAQRLTDLDQAIEALYLGTKGGVPVNDAAGLPIGPLPAHLADRTMVMTFSEFGRRIGENASGTDHGAAAPMLFVAPPAPPAGSGQVTLVPGLHADHPPMGSVTLPADNLAMTTDVRSVYQAVLTHWLDDPSGPSPDEGDPQFVLSGPSLDADGSLSGLFAPA